MSCWKLFHNDEQEPYSRCTTTQYDVIQVHEAPTYFASTMKIISSLQFTPWAQKNGSKKLVFKRCLSLARNVQKFDKTNELIKSSKVPLGYACKINIYGKTIGAFVLLEGSLKVSLMKMRSLAILI